MSAVLICIFSLITYDVCSSDIISHLTREKCIGELGCFSANVPFFDIVERPLSLLPNDREHINTQFWLYTPSNPSVPQKFSNMHGQISDVVKSPFNPQADTKFVVPGYISHTSPEWKKDLVDVLLMHGGSNVFLIDWSGGDGYLYEQAVANTRVVGAEIALFIKRLQDFFGLKTENLHIIGHSLGSHIAGYAGKSLKNLGRITAMEPAGPYFTNVDPVVRLDRSDALLVDAIHTNAAFTRFQGFGMTESIGHFDFFPNGGHLQPGCKDMGHAVWSFLQNPSFDEEGLREIECNHVRAIQLFISSVRNPGCEMMGVVCDSWEDYKSGKCGGCEGGNGGTCIPLGMQADRYSSLIRRNQSLNIYLNTTAEEPYCLK